MIAHAFATLGFSELVAFTTEWNRRSRRVMEKVDMTRDPDGDFLHPDLPPGHKLAAHVLYRIRRSDSLSRAHRSPPPSGDERRELLIW